jgi:nucleoside-diphosphate-sugar epimerase
MNVLVTGATGFVGSVLCRELVDHGYTVRALFRREEAKRKLDAVPVTFVEGDLIDGESLKRAAQGVSCIFHIGAVYREAKFADSVYWDVNFEGTKRVFEAAATVGAKVIHCSTTGIMGSIEGAPADERHGYNPGDVYQESKLAAELYALEAFEKHGARGCIIRPTMIWGPGDTRLFKLFKGVATRTMPLIGDGLTRNHYVHVADLARGFRLAAESEVSQGKIYLVGGAEVVTLRQTMEAIASFFGVTLLPYRIPVTPLLYLGDLCEMMCRPFGIEPPLHRRRVEFFIKSRAFNCSRARDELGYHPQYTFKEEVAAVAQWYVDNGWLEKQKA